MNSKYIIEIDSIIGLSINVIEKKLIVNYSAYSTDSSVYEEIDIKFNPFTGESLDSMKDKIDSKIVLSEKRRIKRDNALKLDNELKETIYILSNLKKNNNTYQVEMIDGSFRLCSAMNRGILRTEFPNITKSKAKKLIKVI